MENTLTLIEKVRCRFYTNWKTFFSRISQSLSSNTTYKHLSIYRGVQTIETNSYETIHLRPHSHETFAFKTTFIW